MHGFKSVDEYHGHSTSGRYLSAIRIPTLLVNA
jgi:predicted alpha/beta-fold hydrolase